MNAARVFREGAGAPAGWRRAAALCLSIVFAASAVRAESSSIAEFLRGADGDGGVYSAGAGRPSPGVPYLRDAEVRVRNQGFDPGRMRYTLQVSPKGFGEEAASRRLIEATAGRGSGLRDVLRNEALRERYGIVIDQMEGAILADLYARLEALESERIRILERQSMTDAFDLGKILNAENSLTRHREKADEARALAARALERARELEGGAVADFDTSGLADVSALVVRLDGFPGAVDPDNVHLRDARDDVDEARARRRLARAESRRFVRYVEFGYDHGTRRNELRERAEGDDADPARAFLFEVGFRLPWPAGDRSEEVRRRAEEANRRIALDRERAEAEEELRAAVTSVRAAAARHAALAARDAELDIPARLRRYGSLAAADPLVLLTLRQAQWENAIRREAARFDVLRGYIEAADRAGLLARNPGSNLLAADGETE